MSPVNVIEEPVVVAVMFSGLEVTVYREIVLPPLDAGSDHEIVALAFPGIAVTFNGGVGTVAGVKGPEAMEGALVPCELVAVTVKV